MPWVVSRFGFGPSAAHRLVFIGVSALRPLSLSHRITQEDNIIRTPNSMSHVLKVHHDTMYYDTISVPCCCTRTVYISSMTDIFWYKCHTKKTTQGQSIKYHLDDARSHACSQSSECYCNDNTQTTVPSKDGATSILRVLS